VDRWAVSILLFMTEAKLRKSIVAHVLPSEIIQSGSKMKKSILSKRDTSTIKDIIRKKWPPAAQNLENEKNFASYELDNGQRIVSTKAFMAVQTDAETIVPFLGTVQILSAFPSVVVDMGAIKFVCNGAKIMRPGIVKFDTFKKDDLVTVKDVKFSKILAVGRALEDSIISIQNEKGYVIDNLHYIGDPFWEYYKEIRPEI
jgi:malignant T-cell-amplified sequence